MGFPVGYTDEFLSLSSQLKHVVNLTIASIRKNVPDFLWLILYMHTDCDKSLGIIATHLYYYYAALNWIIRVQLQVCAVFCAISLVKH